MERSPKEEATRILHRIYRELDKGVVVISFMAIEGEEGAILGNHIILNPIGQILPTVIHEFIHMFYPDWEEQEVVDKEAEVVAELSDLQMRNLFLRIVPYIA